MINEEEKILLYEFYSDYNRYFNGRYVSDVWLHTGSQNITHFKNNSLENLYGSINLKFELVI